jgi:hypothetical protein
MASLSPPSPRLLQVAPEAAVADEPELRHGLLQRGLRLEYATLGWNVVGVVILVDAYLAGAVLIGLVLNAAFGWWWADPLAGLVIVFYGLREGWEALHHEPAHEAG